MKPILRSGAGAAAALSILAAGHAEAAKWIPDYGGAKPAAPAEAGPTDTPSDILGAVGGHGLKGVGGDADGDAVAGLIANLGQPLGSRSPDEPNPVSDSADAYQLHRANSDVGDLANSVQRLTVGAGLSPDRTVVPEPASWTMTILGFGGIGAALRRRRSQLAPA